MGRPRSFDAEAVLDAAAGEFRVHGFAATSTEQLCAAAGVRRSSLYNTFTSKDELFVQALERYAQVTSARQAEVLDDADLDGGARLRRLLELILAEEQAALPAGRGAGCMTVHTYMTPDIRAADARVQSILDRDLKRRRALLAQVAREGQAEGSVRAELDPDDVAMLIVTLISGLRVAAQTGTDHAQLLRIANAGLAAVLTPEPS